MAVELSTIVADYPGTTVLAIGALGTAAFGIVEGLKWTWIGLYGFRQIKDLLGEPVMKALAIAYGPEYMRLLKAQYRANRTADALPTTLRQGARVGLTPETAEELAKQVGVVGGEDLRRVASTACKGVELESADRNILARFELALDARVDAALALADDKYVGGVRITASVVAIFIAWLVGQSANVDLWAWLVVGIVAVPVAPIAKDVASALQSASKALPGRR